MKMAGFIDKWLDLCARGKESHIKKSLNGSWGIRTPAEH
jgi:hypothetical protein